MIITYHQIDEEARDAVKREVERHVDKLNRILKHYGPDAVLLRCSIEKTPRKKEFGFSLNLTLPTGALHATGFGADVRTSVKAAYAEIEVQVKKHQAKVRKDYVWKRKRDRGPLKPSEAVTAD